MEYAVKHAIEVVLVDTAGRMNNCKALMNELNKITRVTKAEVLFVILCEQTKPCSSKHFLETLKCQVRNNTMDCHLIGCLSFA
jgi:signal recognition particle GTPase